MKVSLTTARADKDGRHNDRNFDLDLAEHIDRTRVNQNLYWTYNGVDGQTFLDLEKQYSEDHFIDAINAQNARNEAAGHKERNKSLDDYYTATRTRPEDVILQIGDFEEHATGDELWRCALAYRDKFEETFGENCKILDMALHMDETTPHVHIRRVWQAHDENGNEIVSQEKALRSMEILRPDNTKPNDKFNNAKMVFTQVDREMFTSICEDEGFIIERTPERRRRHLSKDEYVSMKETKVDRDNDYLFQIALQDERLARMYAEKIKEAEEKSLIERTELANKIAEDFSAHRHEDFPDIFDERLRRIKSENDLSDEAKFIEEKGLKSEFEEWKNSSQKEGKTEYRTDEKSDERPEQNSYDPAVNFF